MSPLFTGNLTRVKAGDSRVTLHHGDPIPEDIDVDAFERLQRLGVVGDQLEPEATEPEDEELVDAANADEDTKGEAPDVDAAFFDLDALKAYLDKVKPNAPDTLALAGDDPARQAMLLDAEVATRNRKGVREPLEELVDAANAD